MRSPMMGSPQQYPQQQQQFNQQQLMHQQQQQGGAFSQQQQQMMRQNSMQMQQQQQQQSLQQQQPNMMVSSSFTQQQQQQQQPDSGQGTIKIIVNTTATAYTKNMHTNIHKFMKQPSLNKNESSAFRCTVRFLHSTAAKSAAAESWRRCLLAATEPGHSSGWTVS